MLEVTIYDVAGRQTAKFRQEDDTDFDYVSLVSNQTYGPPALVAPNKGQPPTAKIEDRVLYVNTSLVPLFSIERISD